MPAWEHFESDCTDYLNRRFGAYATFTHKGGSDSTVSDIHVTTNSGRVFYIDAKACPAQCGQFVLLPDPTSKTFIYSAGNALPLSPASAAIKAYMDRSFDAFEAAGTAGKDILMEDGPAVFATWIMENYKHKQTEYFITTGMTIVPVERFSDFFSVSAKYRVKRSGSRKVGKTASSFVSQHIQAGNYGVSHIRPCDGKLFVSADKNIHNTRFTIDGTEYMFSRRENEYEVRKLSGTFHANVIFHIDLKCKDGMTDEDFIRQLR